MLRSGADEIIDALSDGAIDALGNFDALDGIVNELGDGMSKAAGHLIAAQMATEKVRKVGIAPAVKRSSYRVGSRMRREAVLSWLSMSLIGAIQTMHWHSLKL